MNEKRTYKRFDLLAGLAILGCIGVLLFECFFIFELYDRAALQPEALIPAQPAVSLPAVNPSNGTNLPAVEKPVPAQTNSAPVLAEPPAEAPPAEIEKAPARREPVESVNPVTPAVVPAG